MPLEAELKAQGEAVSTYARFARQGDEAQTLVDPVKKAAALIACSLFWLLSPVAEAVKLFPSPVKRPAATAQGGSQKRCLFVPCVGSSRVRHGGRGAGC